MPYMCTAVINHSSATLPCVSEITNNLFLHQQKDVYLLGLCVVSHIAMYAADQGSLMVCRQYVDQT